MMNLKLLKLSYLFFIIMTNTLFIKETISSIVYVPDERWNDIIKNQLNQWHETERKEVNNTIELRRQIIQEEKNEQQQEHYQEFDVQSRNTKSNYSNITNNSKNISFNVEKHQLRQNTKTSSNSRRILLPAQTTTATTTRNLPIKNGQKSYDKNDDVVKTITAAKSTITTTREALNSNDNNNTKINNNSIQVSYDTITNNNNDVRLHLIANSNEVMHKNNENIHYDNDHDERKLLHAKESSRKRRETSNWLIAPNTVWCGRGNIAEGKYNALGGASAADKCCRKHDHCKHFIPTMTNRYEMFNYRPYTLSHCNCDRRFRTCLKMANDEDATTIGQLFFNMIQTECFTFHVEKVCRKRSADGECEVERTRRRAVSRKNKRF